MEIKEITPAYLREKGKQPHSETNQVLVYLLFCAMRGKSNESFYSSELKKTTIIELRKMGFQVKWFKQPFEEYVISFSESSINDLIGEDPKD